MQDLPKARETGPSAFLPSETKELHMHLVKSIDYRVEKPWHGLRNRLEAGQPIEI